MTAQARGNIFFPQSFSGTSRLFAGALCLCLRHKRSSNHFGGTIMFNEHYIHSFLGGPYPSFSAPPNHP
jgi:hypothetical protein